MLRDKLQQLRAGQCLPAAMLTEAELCQLLLHQEELTEIYGCRCNMSQEEYPVDKENAAELAKLIAQQRPTVKVETPQPRALDAMEVQQWYDTLSENK